MKNPAQNVMKKLAPDPFLCMLKLRNTKIS